jgi:hypothetical protein
MYYLPLLILCSLSSPDLPCMRFKDAIQTPYFTEAACTARLEAIYREVTQAPWKVKRNLPGPYKVRALCTVPRSETFSLAFEKELFP